jgi:hypothetical protein
MIRANRLRIAAIGVIVLLCGCSPRQSLIEEASEREFGSSAYGCADTIAVAKAAGVDYVKTVDAAKRKERAALKLLFRLTTDARFDAASAQGHAVVLGSLLRRLGDKFFASCLVEMDVETREAVGEEISYDMGEADSPAEPEWRAKYPKTFAACSGPAVRRPGK